MYTKGALVIALAGLAAPASAEAIFTWDWNRGDPGSVQDRAGTWESVSASYSNISNTVSFDIVFSDQVTNAITLAVNGGPNPKGTNDELALLYIADGHNQPEGMTMSAFVYNGQNNARSYLDSDGQTNGDQAPILLESSEQDDSFIHHLTKTDTPDGKRTFSFSIDATAINAYIPGGDVDAEGADNWTGLAWGHQIGWWIHSWDNRGASGADYDNAGQLVNWNFGLQGWFDGTGGDTDMRIVPLPTAGAMAMLGLAGVAGVRRRG